jgi:hypothetical protein
MALENVTGRASPVVSQLPERAKAERAFVEVRAELAALRPEEVRRVTVDLPFAVTLALGAAPRLAALRPAIVAALPLHPIETLDRLETYAFAAYYAHLLTLPATKSVSERAKLIDEARALRGALLLGAEALAARSLVDAALVAKIRSGAGHLDMAGDLIALGAVLGGAWGAIHDKTAVTLEEVQRAGALGALLLVALGADTQPSVAAAGEDRARAFTLLHRAYDECRRAVAYLRFHEGDAERITPSLFTREARAKKPAEGEPAAEPTGGEPEGG